MKQTSMKLVALGLSVVLAVGGLGGAGDMMVECVHWGSFLCAASQRKGKFF